MAFVVSQAKETITTSSRSLTKLSTKQPTAKQSNHHHQQQQQQRHHHDHRLTTSYYCSNHVLVNQARIEVGRLPCRRSRYLDNLARFHARQMAQECRLRQSFHSIHELKVKLRAPIVAENVQCGSCIRSMHEIVMERSCSNRNNILSCDFDEFGVGTSKGSDGKLYLVQLFRRR